jgi:hypothetical protein
MHVYRCPLCSYHASPDRLAGFGIFRRYSHVGCKGLANSAFMKMPGQSKSLSVKMGINYRIGINIDTVFINYFFICSSKTRPSFTWWLFSRIKGAQERRQTNEKT